MQIIYKKGNLLKASERIIVHGVNAQGAIGGGISGPIISNYPDAYVSYMEAYRNGSLLVGSIHPVVINGNRIVVNAVTQRFFGGRDSDHFPYFSYEGWQSVINHLNDLSEEYDETHIAFPLIGAGLAGGKWELIALILETYSKFIPVVYVLNEWDIPTR